MICSVCGRTIPNDATECKHCGNKIRDAYKKNIVEAGKTEERVIQWGNLILKKEKVLPQTIHLEDGEFVVYNIQAVNIDKSLAKEVLLKGTLEAMSGRWYITNRRIIYEGKKSGKKSFAGGFLFGELGYVLGMEKNNFVIWHEQIKNMNIIPYGPLDNVLDIEYQEDDNTNASVYIGLAVYQRLGGARLEDLKEIIERAPIITSFCGKCGTPVTIDEEFCPTCGTKKE